MPCQPDACRARDSEKQGVVGSKFVERCSQEFRAYGLDAGSLLDVVLKKAVEGFGFRQVLLEEPAVGLVSYPLQQRGDGRFDVAHKPQINGRPAAEMFGVFVDLDFLHAIAREKF